MELRGKLIIAADDYGIRETSKPILELAQKGLLDRVAVFSGRVTDDDMQALLRTGVAIDIHLELINLLKSGHEDAQRSVLKRGMHFLIRRFIGSVSTEKVRTEWRRQIVLFRDRFGRLPDGLNSHEHVHYFPEFFPIVAELAKEFGIEYVRLGRYGVIKATRGGLTAKILSLCSKTTRKTFFTSGRVTSDWVTSFDWFANTEEFVEILSDPKYSNVEVVFHPERPHEKAVLQTW